MMEPVSNLLFFANETKVKYSKDDGAMARFMAPLFNPPRGVVEEDFIFRNF